MVFILSFYVLIYRFLTQIFAEKIGVFFHSLFMSIVY